MTPPFPIEKVYAIDATPRQYIERMLILNEEFGSTVEIEGVWRDGDDVRIVTSQADVAGSPASVEQVRKFMAAKKYHEVPGVHLGKEGALTFVDTDNGIVLFDAHGGNFRIDADGDVHVIDAILVKVSSEETDYFLSGRAF